MAAVGVYDCQRIMESANHPDVGDVGLSTLVAAVYFQLAPTGRDVCVRHFLLSRGTSADRWPNKVHLAHKSARRFSLTV